MTAHNHTTVVPGCFRCELSAVEGPALVVTVTRSAGDDRAVLVLIDTKFEPAGDPGLRILVNDDEVYAGKAYDFGSNHEAEDAVLEVYLSDIPYLKEKK